ncbi:hypothetical protein [Novosphingobium clariflavum]|uniref:Uncharacterized protein n=1 Tax=Novosphingobium clariflavum TaxID=2029884 RepID=A0ABV6SE96_9SPHN|nr:hypothetical protein [Novosphingobium clariflavum]
MPFAHSISVGATARRTPRQTYTLPASIIAYRDLWRAAPADVREEFIAAFIAIPTIVAIFAALWSMGPA